VCEGLLLGFTVDREWFRVSSVGRGVGPFECERVKGLSWAGLRWCGQLCVMTLTRLGDTVAELWLCDEFSHLSTRHISGDSSQIN
jgi:hypothetical protein